MNRNRRGQQNKLRQRVLLPMTVRQAQKLLATDRYEALVSVLHENGVINESDPFFQKRIAASLARLAKQKGPDFLIEEVYEDYSGAEEDFDYEEDETTEAGADSPSANKTDLTAENREEGESRPKGTEEVAPQSDDPSEDSDRHGGDGNSGECDAPAQTNSQNKNGQLQPGDCQPGNDQGSGSSQAEGGSPQSARGASQPSGSETGSNPTSGGTGQDGNAQNPDRSSGASSSAALEDGDRKSDKNHELFEGDQPRNADAQESGGSHLTEVPDAPAEAGEGDRAVENDFQEESEQSDSGLIENGIGEDDRTKPGDDCPTHQKKWGKKIGKAEKSKLSADANGNHGGVTASLQKIGVDAKLLKLCRQRLAGLVGDSSQDYSPRRDYQEFCVRLKTYRNPQPARKEEQGRPVILIMADVSGSCSSFSEQSVAVAEAASKLGVPGADVLVLTHSNGYPYELEHNGKGVPLDAIANRSGYEHAHTNAAWYDALTQRYQIQAVIALGDWDAADDYMRLALHPVVERFIWLDNAYCSSRGTVQDRSKMALKRIEELRLGKASTIRHKFVYRDGCKDAIAFIENIK